MQRKAHDIFLSPEVLRELSDPKFKQQDLALEMTVDLNILTINQDVLGLASILVREQVMPGPESAGDALHVAVATVYGVEYMLSWNVKHLANVNKVKHLVEVTRRVGYVAPTIITPDLLWM